MSSLSQASVSRYNILHIKNEQLLPGYSRYTTETYLAKFWHTKYLCIFANIMAP